MAVSLGQASLIVLATLAGLATLTGCGVGASLPPSNTPVTLTPQFTGKVYGGQQPIYGAVINIWAAGTTGTYGTGAASILTGSTVKTAANGTFNINGNFSCTTGQQLYMTATGGDPTGLDNGTVNNTAIELVAALGPCGNLNNTSTYTNINEVTTVAAAFGLGQFFGGFGTTSDFIGAPSTNVIGLVNAFATANNLASTTTGVVTTTTVPTSNANPNYFLSSNDQSKLDTIKKHSLGLREPVFGIGYTMHLALLRGYPHPSAALHNRHGHAADGYIPGSGIHVLESDEHQ